MKQFFLKNTVLISTKINTGSGFTKPLPLSVKHGLASKVHTGTNVVDPKFKMFKWKVAYTVTNRDDNINRCIIDMVENSLFRRDHKRNLVLPQTEMAHKHFRIISNETSPIDFHKGQNSEVNTF